MLEAEGPRYVDRRLTGAVPRTVTLNAVARAHILTRSLSNHYQWHLQSFWLPLGLRVPRCSFDSFSAAQTEV